MWQNSFAEAHHVCVWVWKVSVEWKCNHNVCIRMCIHSNVYSLGVHVPCVPDWQSSLYFADVYSCWEVTWHIVNDTDSCPRSCFRRPARFFFLVWPWLVIVWKEPEIRLLVFWACDSRGTSWSVLASVPHVTFLLDSVWLQPEMRATKKKKKKNNTKKDSMVPLWIYWMGLVY